MADYIVRATRLSAKELSELERKPFDFAEKYRRIERFFCEKM